MICAAPWRPHESARPRAGSAKHAQRIRTKESILYSCAFTKTDAFCGRIASLICGLSPGCSLAEYTRTFAARCPCLSMNSIAESGTPHRFELIPHLNGYRLSIDKV